MRDLDKTYFRKGIFLGLGLSLCLLIVAGVSALIADALHVFSTSQVVSSSQLNANFNKLPPIGSIQAWHKDLGGVPGLPDGWVQCDGQVLNDSESPLNGRTIPNLNNARNAWNSRGTFLRGSTSSGSFENDAFQGHYHRIQKAANIHEYYRAAPPGGILPAPGPDLSRVTGTTSGYVVLWPTDDGTNGPPRFGMETRPVNMSVVWIMRVK